MEQQNNYQPFEELESFIEPKQHEKAEVIAKLSSGDYTLSFSALSAFAISPYAFIAYKVQERKQTQAMMIGDIVHCRVLEPEEFEKRYRIAPVVNATTVEGKNVWGGIFEEMTGEELPRNKADNYVLPKMEDLIEEIKAKTGITVIPGKVAEEGDFRARRLLKNKASRWVINQLTQTEQSVDLTVSDVHIRGRVDGRGEKIILDIKNVVNAEVHAAAYTIKARRLHWQAWIYSQALGIYNYYIACVDGRGEVSVHLIPEKMINQAEIEITEYVERFKDLVVAGMFDPGVWDQSQDFWLQTSENQVGINMM